MGTSSQYRELPSSALSLETGTAVVMVVVGVTEVGGTGVGRDPVVAVAALSGGTARKRGIECPFGICRKDVHGCKCMEQWDGAVGKAATGSMREEEQ
jgi:hypothetical protein